jgi:penicillin-binding protein-related factor A (putative recombinase)
VSSGMTLQKLVNRCVYLYTNDADFKKKIDDTNSLQISGSAF